MGVLLEISMKNVLKNDQILNGKNCKNGCQMPPKPLKVMKNYQVFLQNLKNEK